MVVAHVFILSEMFAQFILKLKPHYINPFLSSLFFQLNYKNVYKHCIFIVSMWLYYVTNYPC